MQKQKLIIFSAIMLFGLIAGIYQYAKEFQAEFTNAAGTKPANGHLWKEMECDSGSLCFDTLKSNLGIGATSPNYKLDVQGGQINSSGGLCIAGDCKTSWAAVGTSNWTVSSANIYNNNTGNVGIGIASPTQKLEVKGGILASEDICTAQGVCLNQLKSYAVNPNNIVLNVHTKVQCEAAGGHPTSIGEDQFVCKFTGSGCPTIGKDVWLKFMNWTTTSPNKCPRYCRGGDFCFSCGDSPSANYCFVTQSHAFADREVEDIFCSQQEFCGGNFMCKAAVTEIGCY